jgi:PAS domain S-box-containing protein
LVGILGVGRDITIRKKLEKALKNQAHKLFQRVKELNCLFGISELLDKPGHSLDQILQGIVDLIPLGWQYPEITCAKLNLHKKVYATKNFKETIWKQTCDFHVHGDPAGSLKVCYLEEKPSKDDEPFLKEEKKMLKSIAERVGKIVEGKQAHEALWESEKRFHELFNNMSNGVAVFKAVNDGEDFIFVDFNKAGERIDNLKKETLIGKSLLEVYPDVKEFGLFDVLQRVWSTGNSEHTPVQIYKDGRFCGLRENYAYKLLSGEIVTVYDDITERIKAQEAMRKSEARYRALSEATFEAIFVSEKGVCLDTNQRAAELFGYDYDELIGIFGTDVIATESKKSVKRKMLSGYEKPYEAIAQKKDGTKFYVEICGKMMKYKNKDVRMTVIRDINEQKRAAEALRKSEKRYRDLFNSIPIGLYRTTPEGSILDVNPTMLEILGYPDQDALLQTKTLETYIYPNDRKQFQRLLGEKGFVHDFTVQLRRHDGRSIWVTINATIVHDPNGQMTYYEGAMADISDRKASEERIHKLSQQLMQAQEDERQMISRELHDTVAQDLTVAKMACDLVYNELVNGRLPEAQGMKEISGTLQKTISGVRNMAYDLRPPGLEKLGLVETIYRFCEDFTQMWGMPVDFQSAGLKNLKLDYGIQINLYRLVQEGLTNVRKHAAADRVTLKLAAAFPNIILRVEDNGHGFDVQARAAATDHEKRMGLRSMQERVTLLNGKMTLKSKPGQGTKVTIKLPFEEKESDAKENHLNR